MCVIELKTYRHSDGRRSKKEKTRFCHEGLRRGSLCDHVERKGTASAPVSDVMASSSSRPSSSADIITTGRDGRERQYIRVSSKRSSLEASSANARHSAEVLSSSLSLATREVRPSASGGDRPHRRSIKYSYATAPDRSVGLDGSTDYERPPSLEVPQSGGNAESPTTQGPSLRKARPRAIIVDTGASMTGTTSSLGRSSPGLSNLPRLSRHVQDLDDDTAYEESRGKYQARVDSLADDDEFEARSLPEEDERQVDLGKERIAASERYQEELISRDIEAQELQQAQLERDLKAEADRRQDERVRREIAAQNEEQARLERARIAETHRRQSDRESREAKAREEDQARRERNRKADADRRKRVRMSQEAEVQARHRAEEAQRERYRQETAAALQKATEEEHQRHVNAEYAQMARERNVADAHVLAASSPALQYYEPRSVPISPREITYTAVPASSPISARHMTNTYLTHAPTSSRPVSARYPVAIHNNYSSTTPKRDSLREHGDAVIAQTQAAAAQNRARRLSTSMGRLGLRDEELDGVIDARLSGRQSAEGWERQRVRERFERRQEYY